MTKTLFISFVFICFYSLQFFIPFNKKLKDHNPTNFSLGLLSFVCSIALVLILKSFIPNSHLLEAFALPLIVNILITLIVLDLVSYFWHRANHKIDLLWRLHRVHHSETNMQSSTAFRFHLIETGLSLVPRFLVILILGLPLETLIFFEVAYQFFNIFEHSNIKLPSAMEYVIGLLFVTPAMHRRHHFVNHIDQQTNFTTIFNVWDKLFGTYLKNDRDTECKFGIDAKQKEYSLAELLVLPFKSRDFKKNHRR